MTVSLAKDKQMKQLLKFSATWCGPCKSLSNNFANVDLREVELVNVDIEEQSEKAVQYGIRGVPTMVLLEDGVEVKRKSGVMMADQIEAFIHD
jgi:thioredoxin-like negative regulator of GroEL